MSLLGVRSTSDCIAALVPGSDKVIAVARHVVVASPERKRPETIVE